jgi:hypothetical protein
MEHRAERVPLSALRASGPRRMVTVLSALRIPGDVTRGSPRDRAAVARHVDGEFNRCAAQAAHPMPQHSQPPTFRGRPSHRGRTVSSPGIPRPSREHCSARTLNAFGLIESIVVIVSPSGIVEQSDCTVAIAPRPASSSAHDYARAGPARRRQRRLRQRAAVGRAYVRETEHRTRRRGPRDLGAHRRGGRRHGRDGTSRTALDRTKAGLGFPCAGWCLSRSQSVRSPFRPRPLLTRTFGPGNSSKGPNDGGAKCHPPGQTVNEPGCK